MGAITKQEKIFFSLLLPILKHFILRWQNLIQIGIQLLLVLIWRKFTLEHN